MKKRIFGKSAVFLLSLVILLSVFTYAVSASGYATANDFIISVARIDTAINLSEKQEYIDLATETLESYIEGGGSTSDEDIASVYALYVVYRDEAAAKIAICEEFMNYVDLASNPNNSYTETRGYLDQAGAIIASVDRTYYGISSSVSKYNNIIASLDEAEEISALFVEHARLAAEATVYADVKKNYEIATITMVNLTIPDYPGLDEAKANLNTAKTFMGLCELEAAEFVLAVEALENATDIPSAVSEAYELLETIDKTTDGVDVAVTSLKAAERRYNKGVSDANEEIDAINSFILDFLF